PAPRALRVRARPVHRQRDAETARLRSPCARTPRPPSRAGTCTPRTTRRPPNLGGDAGPGRPIGCAAERRPMARKELELEAFAELVGSIYEAAFDPRRWQATLPRLVAALHGERGFLGFTSTLRGHSRSTISCEMDPEFLTRWQGEFAGADPWYDRSGALPTGTVVQGLEVVPYDDLRRTEVHAALFDRFGIDDLLC